MLGRLVYSGVVFMPTLALHFSIAFLGDNVPPKTLSHLKIAYFFTMLFFVLVWTSAHFITGVYDYSWGYYPKGGFIHKIHVLFVVITALFGVYLLAGGAVEEKRRNGKTNTYYETKYLCLAFLFATMSAIDFLANMGIDIYPPGFIFFAIFIYATTYAIFKHNLLGVSIIIKKSLVYSILISIIIALYFLGIYIIGNLVKDWAQIRSTPLMLILLTVITLLSRPLEKKITDATDRLFFKKTHEVMEKENLLLHRELQKQDQLRAIATLASGMAHEIKNPLTAIKTFTDYLPEKSGDPEFIRRFTKVVGSEVEKIDSIVRDVLEFSKPSPPKLEQMIVKTVICDTLDLLNNAFLNQKITVKTEFGESVPPILADHKQVRQVFLNLFLNAAQAMPEGGTLTVTSSLTRDTRLEISIHDTGQGIPKEDLDKIFEPFFTTKETGTGLGLSIVSGIIKEHGGKIQAQSAPGIGTTIRVSFKAV